MPPKLSIKRAAPKPARHHARNRIAKRNPSQLFGMARVSASVCAIEQPRRAAAVRRQIDRDRFRHAPQRALREPRNARIRSLCTTSSSRA